MSICASCRRAQATAGKEEVLLPLLLLAICLLGGRVRNRVFVQIVCGVILLLYVRVGVRASVRLGIEARHEVVFQLKEELMFKAFDEALPSSRNVLGGLVHGPVRVGRYSFYLAHRKERVDGSRFALAYLSGTRTGYILSSNDRVEREEMALLRAEKLGEGMWAFSSE